MDNENKQEQLEMLEKITEATLETFLDIRQQAINSELAFADNFGILLGEDHKFVFDRYAYAFVVRPEFGDDDTVTPDLRMIGNNGDAYQLLEDISTDLDKARELTSSVMFGIFTQGYGVSLDTDDDTDVAPSEHPNRKRVQLVHLVSMMGDFASAMKIEDIGEIITESNSAQGAITEALGECVTKAVKLVEASMN